MEYYVYMTNNCNLNCEYCSVLTEASLRGIPLKPIYSNDDLVNFIQNTQTMENDNDVEIYFFGGEPSLEYDASIKLTGDIRNKLSNYNLKFILHTNGLLLQNITEILLNNLAAIIYSINYEMIPQHNLHNSYFSKVLDNLILVKQRKKLCVVGRMTITSKTSLYTEISQFSPFFDYIYWQLENNSDFVDFKKFFATYIYEMEMTFAYWLEYLGRGVLLRYVPFMSALRSCVLRDKDDMTFSCGYGKKMIYVQTNGKCYSCCDSVDSRHHYIGSVYEGVNLEKPSLHELRCAKCRHRFMCYGRCGRMHREFSRKQISRYCAINKKMFNLFLNNLGRLKEIIARYPFIVDELKSDELNYTEFTP